MTLHAVVWLTLAPVAIVILILAILVLTRYQKDYLSCDVYFISIIVALLLDMTFTFPAQVNMVDEGVWPSEWCSVFFWVTMSLRGIETISFCLLCIDRAIIIRRQSQAKHVGFGSSITIKIIVILTWLFPALLTLVPILGVDSKIKSSPGRCQYLPHEFSQIYAIFLLIVENASFFLCTICSVDAYYSFKAKLKSTRNPDHTTSFNSYNFHGNNSHGNSAVTLLSNSASGNSTPQGHHQTPSEVSRCGSLNTNTSTNRNELERIKLEYHNCKVVLSVTMTTLLIKILPISVSSPNTINIIDTSYTTITNHTPSSSTSNYH